MNIKNRKAIIGTGPQRVQKPIKILNFSAQNEHQKFQSYYRNAPKTDSKPNKKYRILASKMNIKNSKAIIGTGPKRVQKPIKNT